MKAHIIKDGKVDNTIEVESLDFMPGLVDGSSGKRGDAWDGETFTSPAIPEPDPLTFDELKAETTYKINSLFKVETSKIKGSVMQEEVDTFNTQEKEALAYQSDDTADVPLISGLASVRGLTVGEISTRVLAHAAAYKYAIAQSMGKKHSFEDAVKNAGTLEDLKAIEVI